MAAAFLLDAARVAYYVFEVYSSKKQSPRKHCRSTRSSKRTRRASPLKPQAAPTTAEKPLDLARYGFDNSLLVSLWRRILNPPVQHYGPVVRYRPTTCKPSSHPRTVEVLITPQELRVIAPALKHMTSILRPVFPPFIRPVTCILDGNQCFTTGPVQERVQHINKGDVILYSPHFTWCPQGEHPPVPSLSPPLSFSPLTMTVIPAVYELLDICSSILVRSTLTRAPQPLLRLHLEPAREDDPFALNSQTGALVLYQPPQWGFPCVNELLHYPCEPELVEVSRKVTNIFPDLRRLLLSGPFPCLIPTAPTPSLDSRTGALILYTPPLSATFVQVFNDEDEPTYEVSPLVTEVFSIILLSAGSLVGSTLLLGFPVNSPKISAQPSLDLILMIARKERQFCCYHSMALVIYSPLVWFPPISTKALSATKLPPQIIELTLMLARKFIEQKQTRNAQETIIEAQPIEPEVKTPRPRIRPVPRSLFLRNIVVNQQKSNNKPASPFTPIKASCPQSSPTTANRERPMAKLPLSGGVRLGIVSSPNPNKKKENGDAPTPQAAKPNPMPQPISSRSKRKKAAATPSRK